MATPKRLELIDEHAVSQWLDVPVPTLRDWRKEEINLPFIRLSDRKVRYDVGAVSAYLKAKEVQVEGMQS